MISLEQNPSTNLCPSNAKLKIKNKPYPDLKKSKCINTHQQTENTENYMKN